ncbi:MAG: bifunctional diaminohydroxyphosphoribosylaminopyrimidine deaminase/5-amino-6-(5-phosphoribosylamino)uracil reductase RibD [Phycisphaerales bacterium]
MSTTPLDLRMIRHAALAGWRGFGRVEPNPMVGCVIGTVRGEVLGVGWHRVFGGPHAEVEAIADCERRGHPTHGATAWVTLEPCNHFGKTPPCTDALLRAGIARVVFARRDPNKPASGGAERLAAAGVECVEVPPQQQGGELALRLSDPFIKRLHTGLPWVIAKWAQTLDGKVATRTGDSKWISGESSRAMVHRLRGRVDAVLTGIGTVRADNPRLTARPNHGQPRRTPRRCIIDPRLETPREALLLTGSAAGANDGPVTLFTTPVAAHSPRAEELRRAGVEVVPLPTASGGSLQGAGGASGLDLAAALRHLARAHDALNVLVESGPGLLGRLIAAGLVDEALVFIAPKLLGDPAGLSPAAVGEAPSIARATALRMLRVSRREQDIVVVASMR